MQEGEAVKFRVYGFTGLRVYCLTGFGGRLFFSLSLHLCTAFAVRCEAPNPNKCRRFGATSFKPSADNSLEP